MLVNTRITKVHEVPDDWDNDAEEEEEEPQKLWEAAYVLIPAAYLIATKMYLLVVVRWLF